MGDKYIKRDAEGDQHLYEKGDFGDKDLGKVDKSYDTWTGGLDAFFDIVSGSEEEKSNKREDHSDSGGSSDSDSSGSGGGGGLGGCLIPLIIGAGLIIGGINFLAENKHKIKQFFHPPIKGVCVNMPKKDINLDGPFPGRAIDLKSISIEKVVGKYRYTYKPLSWKREMQIFEAADLDDDKILEKDERSELVRRIKDAVIQDRRKNVNPRKVRKMILDSYSSNPQISKQHEDVEEQNHQTRNNQQESQKNYETKKEDFQKNKKVKKPSKLEKLTEKYFFSVQINSEENLSIEYSEKSGSGGLYDSRNSSKIMIDKEKYPGFYKELNIKERPLRSCGEILNKFSKFANKYPADMSVKSIVNEFVSKYSNSRKDYSEKRDNSKIYESLNPNSEFSKNTPKGYMPVIIEKKDERGNVISQKKEYISQEEAKNSKSHSYEQHVHYPKTGNEYWIDGDKYPEYFEIVDLNHDGKVSSYEMGKFQGKFGRIVKKYPEGDIESIVNEFVSKYSK